MLLIIYNNIVLLGYLIVSTILSLTDIPSIFILYWIIAIGIGCIAAIFRTTEFPEKQCVKYCLKSHIKKYNKYPNKYKINLREITHYLPIIADDTKLSWYYYICTSHNLWHLLIHCGFVVVLYTFKEYLIWRSHHQCS